MTTLKQSAVLILMLAFALAAVPAAQRAAAPTPGALAVAELRTEYAANPVGIDARQPRFSGQLRTPARGVVQSAYQVQVASTERALQSAKALLWDSGVVTSADSVNVDYGGPFGVKIVADEDADWIAPNFPGGPPAPADIGVVNHIVVEQRSGTNELHQTGELVMIATGVAAETGGEQEQKRSDAFSADVQNVGGDGVDKRHAGIKVRTSLAFHPLQLITVGLPDVCHAVNRGSDWAWGHARMVGQRRKQSQASQPFERMAGVGHLSGRQS